MLGLAGLDQTAAIGWCWLSGAQTEMGSGGPRRGRRIVRRLGHFVGRAGTGIGLDIALRVAAERGVRRAKPNAHRGRAHRRRPHHQSVDHGGDAAHIDAHGPGIRGRSRRGGRTVRRRHQARVGRLVRLRRVAARRGDCPRFHCRPIAGGVRRRRVAAGPVDPDYLPASSPRPLARAIGDEIALPLCWRLCGSLPWYGAITRRPFCPRWPSSLASPPDIPGWPRRSPRSGCCPSAVDGLAGGSGVGVETLWMSLLLGVVLVWTLYRQTHDVTQHRLTMAGAGT